MASKRKREGASASANKRPAHAVQSKVSATSSASAPTIASSFKTPGAKKAPAKKAPIKKVKVTKKTVPKKPSNSTPKKDDKKEIKASEFSDAEAEIVNLEPLEVDDSPKFTLFNKLPLEVRLRIWGLAAPDPCVVHQQDSSKPSVRFRYVREEGKVPGVLHACRESRYEFLEENDESNDETLARRRRAHPVYKLYFHNTRSSRTSRPVFFSTDVDTFWPADPTDVAGWYDNHAFLVTTELDVAKNLKYLALKGPYISRGDFVWYSKRFPKLESFTLLQCDRRYNSDTQRFEVINYAPEVNGELSLSGLADDVRTYIDRKVRESKQIKEMVKGWAEQQPGQKFPLVKLRFESQFIANEGIQIPQKPKDPLDDLD